MKFISGLAGILIGTTVCGSSMASPISARTTPVSREQLRTVVEETVPRFNVREIELKLVRLVIFTLPNENGGNTQLLYDGRNLKKLPENIKLRIGDEEEFTPGSVAKLLHEAYLNSGGNANYSIKETYCWNFRNLTNAYGNVRYTLNGNVLQTTSKFPRDNCSTQQ